MLVGGAVVAGLDGGALRCADKLSRFALVESTFCIIGLANPKMPNEQDEAWEASDDGCYVALTHDHLNAQEVIDRVRSPAAGAIVLFAGK